MSIADGDDDHLVGIDNFQHGPAPPLRSLEDHVLQVARRDPSANAEGVQLRKAANASISPEAVRLQVREAQLSTRVSKMRSQETTYQHSC